VKTMAEVLAEHHSKSYNAELGTVFCLDPTCRWDGQANNFAVAADVFSEHQEAMLTAAGFGPVKEANAKVQELAKRLLNEDITDSLDILDKLASGNLTLIGTDA
jgi:hypothetical protein